MRSERKTFLKLLEYSIKSLTVAGKGRVISEIYNPKCKMIDDKGWIFVFCKSDVSRMVNIRIGFTASENKSCVNVSLDS